MRGKAASWGGSERSKAMRRAKRCSAPSDASCPAERSILAPLLYASVPSGRAVHSPSSIVHCPLFLLPLTLQSYNTGEAKSSIWRKQRRAARVFLLACRRSALIVNRLVANGLSSFALAPLVLRLRLALCCYSVTVLQFQNGYYAGSERNKTNFYIYNIYIIYIGYYFACWNFFLRTVTL